MTEETLLALRQDPVLFSEEILGHQLYSKQKEVYRMVAAHDRVAIGSGHKVGKTFTGSDLVLWFLFCYPGSIVITTAHDNRQVKFQMWKEIRKKYAESNFKNYFPNSECLTTFLRMDEEDTSFAIGFATKDKDSSAFQGYHAPYAMILIDEASGISNEIWEGALSMESEVFKIVALGNMLDPLSKFVNLFESPIWKSATIPSWESPNITGEMYVPGLATKDWIEDMKLEWGENSFIYKTRVAAECPKDSLGGVISYAALKSIVRKANEITHEKPYYAGLDVADLGGDLTVLTLLDANGQHVNSFSWEAKTTETEGRVLDITRNYAISKIAIDALGVGIGVANGLADSRELRGKVIYYKGSENALRPDVYANKSAEAWCWVDEAVKSGDLTAIQDTKFLISDLAQRHKEVDRQGRISVEPKAKYNQRLGRSPDFGDSFVLANVARRYGKGDLKTGNIKSDSTRGRKGSRQNEFAKDLAVF